jgi:hypothetical protein
MASKNEGRQIISQAAKWQVQKPENSCYFNASE